MVQRVIDPFKNRTDEEDAELIAKGFHPVAYRMHQARLDENSQASLDGETRNAIAGASQDSELFGRSRKREWSMQRDGRMSCVLDVSDQYAFAGGRGNRAALIRKAYDATAAIAGSWRSALRPWFDPSRANPFAAYIDFRSSGEATLGPGVERRVGRPGGSVFNFPEVEVGPFKKTATVSDTYGGSLSGVDVATDYYDSLSQFSMAANVDVDELRGSVEEATIDAAMGVHGKAIADVVIASVKGKDGAQQVATGASGALPSATNAIPKLAAMRKAQDSKYKRTDLGMNAYFVSSEMYELLCTATANSNSGYAFDPSSEIMSLWGIPVIETDYLESGGAAGECSAIYGNLFMAFMLGEVGRATMFHSDETKQGMDSFYTAMRFGVGAKKPDAIVGLVSDA